MKPKELFNVIKTAAYRKAGEDTLYCILQDPEELVIRLVLRGSLVESEWKENFQFPKTIYSLKGLKLRCHAEYVYKWFTARESIMADLISACNRHPGWTVHICGHGKGGAYAELAAEEFYNRVGRRAFVYTFGSPAIWGNKFSARHVRNCTNGIFGMTEHNDAVSRFSLPWFNHPNSCLVGEKFNLFKFLFKASKYHSNYTDTDYGVYGGLNV